MKKSNGSVSSPRLSNMRQSGKDAGIGSARGKAFCGGCVPRRRGGYNAVAEVVNMRHGYFDAFIRHPVQARRR
ncbi:hypothetical protein FACS1894206_03520 [Deltaproteobacteria bacterium]|nr:hypothetical protein FACS1894206_03520 [Deltaproteobacteria bacterium]